ncbi:MAG: HAMP domain-containing histidine kinase [Myxococcales bacterium]|nr:HAMP domain-containing histidine kinase [Myxococcales bacterium]
MHDDLARTLRRRSLSGATPLYTGLFGLGSLMGLVALAKNGGSDLGVFFAPFTVFAGSAVSLLLDRRGRPHPARALFTGVNLLYVGSIMTIAPPLIRVSIGFPLTALVLFLFHLLYPARHAARVGWTTLALVLAGTAQLLLTTPGEWMMLTACVVQVLVIGFANLVLERLGRGWTDALATTDEARRQLASAYRVAMEASEAKSNFLASMSHELRTPLNAIIGYAELVEEDVEAGDLPAADDLGRIQTSGRHLLQLVNQVLDLSRVESGRMELELASLDLAEVVAEVADTLRGQVEARGTRLVLELEPVPTLRLDRLRVKQIVTNLVANATKFTDEGTITISLQQAPDEVCIRVHDTGVGIPPDRQKRIFEPFLQADGTVSRTHGGTGLGLAISRGLAEQMHGKLDVASQPGEGSTFSLCFPLPA